MYFTKMANMIKGFSVVFIIALFTGCGGSSSGGDPTGDNNPEPTPESRLISGVAAAGAPVVGTVFVKGANGAVVSSSIGIDGSYSLDVEDLTSPYILRAEGTVKGKSIGMYSAGVTEGNINITPVTDFIIRNALKGRAEDAYSNWGPDSITREAIEEAEADVRAQLAPLLNAAGVPSGIDLIGSEFKADRTGLDAVLNALSISYSGNTATVRNNYTGSSYTDDITKVNDGAGLPESDTATTRQVFTDASAINAFWASLEDLCRSTPSSSAIIDWFEEHVAEDYLDDGQNKEQVIDEWLEDLEEGDTPIKISAAIVEIDEIFLPYTKRYKVRVLSYDEREWDYEELYMVYNGSEWLWQGNRRWLGCFVEARASLTVSAAGSSSFSTGFDIEVDGDDNYAYNRGVRSVSVTGPGLPAGGLIFQQGKPTISRHGSKHTRMFKRMFYRSGRNLSGRAGI